MNGCLHYKGYSGSVEFSEEDEILHGKVMDIPNLVSFEGDSVNALTADFHAAVDDYLASRTIKRRIPAQKIRPQKTFETPVLAASQ
jgi:predicted HicB family RNase H-like nuclease